MNETACLERGQRHQEAIGRDQIHFRMARPAREQCLKQSRCGALSHCDAACDTDHERDVRPLATEERRRRVAKVLRGADVEVEQTRQRQVDVGDFIERDPLVEADESPQLRFGERQRRRSPQPGPLGAAELDESRDSDILAAAGHAGHSMAPGHAQVCGGTMAPSSGGDRTSANGRHVTRTSRPCPF